MLVDIYCSSNIGDTRQYQKEIHFQHFRQSSLYCDPRRRDGLSNRMTMEMGRKLPTTAAAVENSTAPFRRIFLCLTVRIRCKTHQAR